MTREEKFTDIYYEMCSHNYESISGHGSNLDETVNIRQHLPAILKGLGVKTILDAPCGDFNWMRHLDYPFTNYIGMDIVPELIIERTLPHDTENRHFMVGDIVTDPLPVVDFVLCRDCLVHLTLADGVDAIANIVMSGAKYMAFTTYPHLLTNDDCETGGWRPINMEAPPYSLWKPIVLIGEGGSGADEGKMLGVWRVKG